MRTPLHLDDLLARCTTTAPPAPESQSVSTVSGGRPGVMCVPLSRCRRACEADGGRIHHKAGAGGGRPGGVMCVCVPLTRCRKACEADGGRIYHTSIVPQSIGVSTLQPGCRRGGAWPGVMCMRVCRLTRCRRALERPTAGIQASCPRASAYLPRTAWVPAGRGLGCCAMCLSLDPLS